MCLPLIGRGEVWDDSLTSKIPAKLALEKKGIQPVHLQTKDGLALINGTQMMAAYGAFVLERTLALQREADLLAAMSLEALQGSASPFDKRIHSIRPHNGQQIVASNIRKLLEGSEILASHRDCGKVQDPYSLRCVPQVHGASRDALDYARLCIETELNSVTDNPLVFQQGDIISGGNFHGQPLALAMDFAAIALAELASISERRTYLLLEGHDGLPKLLMHDTGVNSGFMMPQYTAAALVSENKILCHPASVDSIPTSLGQEDHVSMGSISAFKLLAVLRNVERVLAVELLTSAQALDFRGALSPGHGVALAHKTLRSEIEHAEKDYEVRNDLDQCADILRSGALLEAVEEGSGPLL
jgi:histidine ammonia-lyase